MKYEIMTKQQAIAIHETNGEPTMSSLRIAEVTGKKHFHVLRDIENILDEVDESAEKTLKSKFGFTYSATDKLGRIKNHKHYLLPEREFMLVISGYSDKYRLQLIDELMSYRRSIKKLTPLEQAQETMKMLDREIQAERENNKLLNQFIDNTMSDEKLVTFETATKLLFDRYAFQIGRNTLMKALRDVGVLMENNNPYQRYSHWFKVVKKKSVNGNIYNVTLIYEDKIKMIYKYVMQEFKSEEL